MTGDADSRPPTGAVDTEEVKGGGWIEMTQSREDRRVSL